MSGKAAFTKALELLGRPARTASGRGGYVLQPYRGYGSREEVFVIGRVFRQTAPDQSPRPRWLSPRLVDLVRRVLRWGVSDATLIARFCGTEERVITDRDGYFRIHMRLAQPPPGDRLWHRMELRLVAPVEARATAELFVPPDRCRYVVISDIDDTVMDTGVASKAIMLWRLFMQGAKSRVAFPGVAAFLRGLHRGASGAEINPMLYVSRAPWSLYEILDEFFRLHGIPIGPILFLREWGLTLQSPLPRRAAGHKLELIRNMLALYRDLPFVLLGDSGQRDPEIYAQISHEHRGRVLAIYIRNVSRDPGRQRAIEALAVEVVEAGSSLLLAADSLAMAAHAAERGLIASDAGADVVRERETQEEHADPQPTVEVHGGGPDGTGPAVEEGELREALEGGEDGRPPNVVVEPEQEKHRPV